jgi:hypothetical protein
MPGTLYSIGYGSRQGRQELARLMRDQPTCLIADVRLVPRSAIPGYTGEALSRRYPGRYWHLPELGNRRYQQARRQRPQAGTQDHPMQEIEIVDLKRGLRQLQILLQDHDVILLCGCSQEENCHRRVIRSALEKEAQR